MLTMMQSKSRALEDVHLQLHEGDSDLKRALREKEEELEICKLGMDETLLQLNELRVVSCIHIH